MNSIRISSIIAALALMAFTACGGGEGEAAATPPGAGEQGSSAVKASGLITAADITLGDGIDQEMVAKGKAIYDVKCQACHSTGANRVVGPGWKGIMERRKPEWIMNMILNVDAMLDSDPEAQKALEECLVRMPNQGLTKDEGREVLEYMRTL